MQIKRSFFFFASDPLKEERQRFMTEQFLINYFSYIKDFVLFIKTHHQDNGNVTINAFENSRKPSNVFLIGDIRQKNFIKSKDFYLFNNFNFNAAILSSDGFLTKSSTSILQALALGVKSGVIDMFGNGNFKELIDSNAISFIDNKESLNFFLNKKIQMFQMKFLLIVA